MKDLPIIKCIHCGSEWRRYAKRKLSPSRNCPKCFHRLRVEGEDYEWISYGSLKHNAAMANIAKDNKTAVKQLTSSDKQSKNNKDAFITNKLPDLDTILNARPQLTKEQKRLLEL
jgi:hypothetical protein